MASLGKRSELRGDAESPEMRQLSPPVEEILDRKAVCGLDYCLVKWKGLPVHAATWEPLEEVAKACDSATLLVRKASAVGPRLLGSSQNTETSREVNNRKRRKRAKKGNQSDKHKIKHSTAEAEAFENNDEESTSAAELHASQHEISACVEPNNQLLARDVEVNLGLRLPVQRIHFDLLDYYKNYQLPMPLTATFRLQTKLDATESRRETHAPQEGSKL